MFTEKDYYFTIVIHPNGRQMPYINYSIKEEDFLKQLVYFQNLQRSSGVKAALVIIEKVLQGLSEQEEIYDRDLPVDVLCFADVKKEISIIRDCTAGRQDYRVKTTELKKLFEKWLEFLLSYENNEIPNLKYAFQ